MLNSLILFLKRIYMLTNIDNMYMILSKLINSHATYNTCKVRFSLLLSAREVHWCWIVGEHIKLKVSSPSHWPFLTPPHQVDRARFSHWVLGFGVDCFLKTFLHPSCTYQLLWMAKVVLFVLNDTWNINKISICKYCDMILTQGDLNSKEAT